MKTFLTTVLLLIAIPALARDESGRTRAYTGMTPSSQQMQVVCPLTGSRCYSIAVSTSSSSRGIVTGKGRTTHGANAVFVDFLKRYIDLPAGWTGEATSSVATFSKAAASAMEKPSSFSVRLFDYHECDGESLTQRIEKAWKAIGKTPPERVSVAKAYGAQGSPHSWVEPAADGTGDRHFCIVPAGHVLTAEAWMSDSDVVAKEVVQRTILMQLYRSDRFGRRR